MKYEQKILEAERRIAVRFSQGDKEVCATLDAAGADALARELALQAALVGAGMPTVQFGRDFVTLEKRVALDVVVALIKGKLRLEELEQAERIARDSAILLRAGANFGLSNDPRILDAAKNAAAWDSELRRCMPGGVKSEEAFGTPALIRHAPRTIN